MWCYLFFLFLFSILCHPPATEYDWMIQKQFHVVKNTRYKHTRNMNNISTEGADVISFRLRCINSLHTICTYGIWINQRNNHIYNETRSNQFKYVIMYKCCNVMGGEGENKKIIIITFTTFLSRLLSTSGEFGAYFVIWINDTRTSDAMQHDII